MEKLISMVDFVLEQHEKSTDHPLDNLEDAKTYSMILNYAKFLQQPLSLGMFVPCDYMGIVLNEHHNLTEENFNYVNPKIIEFHRAKERILFEGFEIIGEKHVGNKYNVFGVGFKNGQYKTIEDLVHHKNSDQDIVLTESAKKQIGL